MLNFETKGIEELIKRVEQLATPRELEKADRAALKRCGEIAHNTVQKLHPRSKNVSKSGRKGSRTFSHAADNIPVKVKRKNGKLYVLIGWDKGDNTAYFYEKFVEFGSSQVLPKAPFKKAFSRTRKQLDKIFEEEYTKLFESLK